MTTHDADGRITALASPGAHSLAFGWNTTDSLASPTDSLYMSAAVCEPSNTSARATSVATLAA